MSKILLIADTHLGLYNSSDFWIKIVVDFFKEIHDVCVRKNINKIIHLGDFFHERKNLNTKVIDAAQEIEYILSPFYTWLIVGNHDCYYKNVIKPTSLQIFKDSESIRIITETTQIEKYNLTLVPWNQIPVGYKGDICLGHFELNGFLMNTKIKCKINSTEMENHFELNEFNKILSGHFHMPQQSGKIQYLGSPYQQSFRDADNLKRGYYVLDTDTKEMEFIEYNKSPRFINIDTETKVEKEDIKGNFIRLKFTKDYGSVENERILRNIHDMEPIKVDPDFSNISDDDTDDTLPENISLIENDQIFFEYMEKQKLPENIKKGTLNGFINSVIKEAYGESRGS